MLIEQKLYNLVMRYFLGGANGTGKTTFVKTLAELDTSFEVVHVTSRLMAHLGIDGDYDRLRQLPQEQLRADLFEVYRLIFDEQEKPHLIADSHYLNTRWGKISLVTDEWIKQFDALLLLAAPVKIVFDRVVADRNFRDRALFDEQLSQPEQLEFYANYLDQTEAEYLRLQREYNLPGAIIDTSGTPKASIERFINFHSSICQEA